ncbi:DUF4398 domain-containing protein [Cognatiluteimonas telluris]|uniref:DUF4398 domain-containing protein n=1 Tax=Cognatiluteimonas telluris TaxID=1104775 RepID=UPI00140E530C|nr:DUF4398 domain-containing protein [Lysobacter telluris]
MNRSFAQFFRSGHANARRLARSMACVTCASVLGACATLPPPTAELAQAQQAVSQANDADADQYAADAIAQARAELAQAQAAMARGRDADARAAAIAASADGEFALASSNAAKTRASYAQKRNELVELGQRLQMQDDLPAASALDIPVSAPPPAVPGKLVDAGAALAARLQKLDSDPRLNTFAAYERLRAHQALDALASARARDQAGQARLAERRVAIAELAARTQATGQQLDRLERVRSEWLVEASRQEAERARQEAERLRVQAQVQAEEAQRLREQADADAAAREQAEAVVDSVGAQAAAKLKAAREKEAALARQEAALMAGSQADKAKTAAGKANPAKKKGK